MKNYYLPPKGPGQPHYNTPMNNNVPVHGIP